MHIRDRKKIFQLVSRGGFLDSLQSTWEDVKSSQFGKTVSETFDKLFGDSKSTPVEKDGKPEIEKSNISDRKSTLKKLKDGDKQVTYQSPIKDSWKNFGGWYTEPGPDHPEGHKGVDMGAARGTPVFPAAEGKVSDVSFGTGKGGNTVNIQHPDGKTTYYAHLDTVEVSVGDEVSKGDVIGTVGNTGNARGKPFHLHFGIRETGRKGSWKDPAGFFSLPSYSAPSKKDSENV